jgi:two-component system CheB/CheR fusion protein
VLVLFKELLINVTSFFRDKEAFEALKKVLRERLEEKTAEVEIRAWVLGCVTGEEAYTIAIIIREILDDLGKNNRVQIFGTDLDSEAIEIARNGVYHSNIVNDVTPERLSRFFKKRDDTYEVNMNIREMLVFATHNVTKEPPFLRLDLLSIRNLLIYLKGDLQKRLMPLFHYSLREKGILFLSPSETIGEHTDLFATIDRKYKIFQAKPSIGAKVAQPPFPLTGAIPRVRAGQTDAGGMKQDVSQLADRILMSEYAPPYVVVDGADNVVFIRGDTSRYLKLAEGRATMNIQELARRGLSSQLSLAIRSARAQKKEASRHNIRVDSPDAPSIDILVRPISQGEQTPEHLMVIFKESIPREPVPSEGELRKPGKGGKAPVQARYVAELEQELKRSREDLQATIEELETSNEELKSSNEELLSSNEELQSTNEELETSREELRSVNEELSNLNADNKERIEQLNRNRDDMANLLNSMNVASVFLDTDMNIKSFTPAAAELFSIREGDIGRPFDEIKSLFEYDKWVEDARSVLKSLAKKEAEVRTKDGKWYLARLQPYRTRENEITGVLLTFFDIDERRIMEAALHYTESIVDTVREPMLVLDKDLRVVSANRSFYQLFRVTEADTVNMHIYEVGNRQWDIPALRKLMSDIIKKDGHFNNYPAEHDFPLIGRRRMLLNARRLYDELGTERILLAMEDVTGQPQVEQLFRNVPEQKEDGR